jgi:hypothetical protein
MEPQTFCLAAKNGEYDMIVSMLSQGADPNFKYKGQPALTHACENGHHKVAELLLNNGALVDQLDSYGQSALHWCARSSNGKCAQLLVARNADPTIVNAMAETPAYIAQQRINLDVTRAILHGNTGEYARIEVAPPPQSQSVVIRDDDTTTNEKQEEMQDDVAKCKTQPQPQQPKVHPTPSSSSRAVEKPVAFL